MRFPSFVLSFVFAVSLASAAAETPTEPDPRAILGRLQQRLETVVGVLSEEAQTAADRISAADVAEEDTRSVLKDLCGALDYSVDCAYIDARGVMVYIEPEDYRAHEGKDISGQEHFARLRETGLPVFSGVFRAVEGFDALDYEHPVSASDGKWQGSVSVLMKPADFIALALGPEMDGLPYEVMVMQTDGLVLYGDEKEIGRRVFTDPMYKDFPSLLELCGRVVKEETGEGTYIFTGKKTDRPREKKAYWTTANAGDHAWRLLLIVE
ncbi:MAG: hypothetical protein PHH75_04810 [Candidatus Omnitrophica bacterium]|nr:hypothetical protein [Candidatus Omnitrophota bacterium]MDD5574482.1 hypothetical protein [Candidatus Omnitrophota bacterium]